MQTGFGASLVKARLVLTLASLIVSYQTCVILYAVAYRAKNCWALASPFHGTLQIGKRNVIILEFLSGVGVGWGLRKPRPVGAFGSKHHLPSQLRHCLYVSCCEYLHIPYTVTPCCLPHSLW